MYRYSTTISKHLYPCRRNMQKTPQPSPNRVQTQHSNPTFLLLRIGELISRKQIPYKSRLVQNLSAKSTFPPAFQLVFPANQDQHEMLPRLSE